MSDPRPVYSLTDWLREREQLARVHQPATRVPRDCERRAWGDPPEYVAQVIQAAYESLRQDEERSAS